MTIIKEFREFFLRNAKVLTGTKKDQEINFATQYTAVLDGVSKTVYNRFLKDNYPAQYQTYRQQYSDYRSQHNAYTNTNNLFILF